MRLRWDTRRCFRLASGERIAVLDADSNPVRRIPDDSERTRFWGSRTGRRGAFRLPVTLIQRPGIPAGTRPETGTRTWSRNAAFLPHPERPAAAEQRGHTLHMLERM